MDLRRLLPLSLRLLDIELRLLRHGQRDVLFWRRSCAEVETLDLSRAAPHFDRQGAGPVHDDQRILLAAVQPIAHRKNRPIHFERVDQCELPVHADLPRGQSHEKQIVDLGLLQRHDAELRDVFREDHALQSLAARGVAGDVAVHRRRPQKLFLSHESHGLRAQIHRGADQQSTPSHLCKHAERLGLTSILDGVHLAVTTSHIDPPLHVKASGDGQERRRRWQFDLTEHIGVERVLRQDEQMAGLSAHDEQRDGVRVLAVLLQHVHAGDERELLVGQVFHLEHEGRAVLFCGQAEQFCRSSGQLQAAIACLGEALDRHWRSDAVCLEVIPDVHLCGGQVNGRTGPLQWTGSANGMRWCQPKPASLSQSLSQHEALTLR
eukprot:scaffold869_cov160-Ochromonas_danica.AAC.16